MRSHVYPEWGYRPLYDEKNRFFALTDVDVQFLRKGLREALLCEECEARLNPCETYVRGLVLQPGRLVLPPRGGRAKNTADYRLLKRFQISLLWRAHVAQGDFWKGVDVGPHHAERLRLMLLNDDAGRAWEYPCVMSAMLLDGEHRMDFIGPIFRHRRDGHHEYALNFGGFAWLYLVSNHSARHWATRYAAQEDGTFYVHVFEVRGSAFARVLLDDVFLPNASLVQRLRARDRSVEG